MDLAEMKKKGMVASINVDKVQIRELIEISKRDLRLAEDMLGKNFDASLGFSYNAMLQSARAFMFSHGYRPNNEFHHRATIEFVNAVLDKKDIEYVEAFDRIRSKRIVATYERAGAISKFEAEHAFHNAEDFVGFITEKINRRLK